MRSSFSACVSDAAATIVHHVKLETYKFFRNTNRFLSIVLNHPAVKTVIMCIAWFAAVAEFAVLLMTRNTATLNELITIKLAKLAITALEHTGGMVDGFYERHMTMDVDITNMKNLLTDTLINLNDQIDADIAVINQQEIQLNILRSGNPQQIRLQIPILEEIQQSIRLNNVRLDDLRRNKRQTSRKISELQAWYGS